MTSICVDICSIRERLILADDRLISALMDGSEAVQEFDSFWTALFHDVQVALDLQLVDESLKDLIASKANLVQQLAEEWHSFEKAQENITSSMLHDVQYTLSTCTVRDLEDGRQDFSTSVVIDDDKVQSQEIPRRRPLRQAKDQQRIAAATRETPILSDSRSSREPSLSLSVSTDESDDDEDRLLRPTAGRKRRSSEVDEEAFPVIFDDLAFPLPKRSRRSPRVEIVSSEVESARQNMLQCCGAIAHDDGITDCNTSEIPLQNLEGLGLKRRSSASSSERPAKRHRSLMHLQDVQIELTQEPTFDAHHSCHLPLGSTSGPDEFLTFDLDIPHGKPSAQLHRQSSDTVDIGVFSDWQLSESNAELPHLIPAIHEFELHESAIQDLTTSLHISELWQHEYGASEVAEGSVPLLLAGPDATYPSVDEGPYRFLPDILQADSSALDIPPPGPFLSSKASDHAVLPDFAGGSEHDLLPPLEYASPPPFSSPPPFQDSTDELSASSWDFWKHLQFDSGVTSDSPPPPYSDLAGQPTFSFDSPKLSSSLEHLGGTAHVPCLRDAKAEKLEPWRSELAPWTI